MLENNGLPPGETRWNQLINALARKDKAMNDRAMEAFIYMAQHVEPPEQLMRDLVLEACASDKRPAHRLRILDVVQKLDKPIGISTWMTLYLLASISNKKVALKATEIMVARQPTAAMPQQEYDSGEMASNG